MAYYYVKSSGSSTTAGGTTKQTGAFSGLAASAVYTSVASAITYGAGSDDFILVSDAQNYSYTGNMTYTGPTLSATYAAPLTIMSVSDTNCDQYSAGATEQTTGTDDVSLRGHLSILGMTLISADQSTYIDCQLTLRYCTITQSTDFISVSGDGSDVKFVDCTTTFGGSGNQFRLSSAGTINYVGGSIVTTGATKSIITGFWSSGGGVATFTGVDMSTVNGVLFPDLGNSQANQDIINVKLKSCQLNAGASFTDSTIEAGSQNFLATGSSSSSSAAEYQYYLRTYTGVAQTTTSKYRDSSTAFPSGQKVSIQVVTESKTSKYAPFVFESPMRFAELSNTASDVLTV